MWRSGLVVTFATTQERLSGEACQLLRLAGGQLVPVNNNEDDDDDSLKNDGRDTYACVLGNIPESAYWFLRSRNFLLRAAPRLFSLFVWERYYLKHWLSLCLMRRSGNWGRNSMAAEFRVLHAKVSPPQPPQQPSYLLLSDSRKLLNLHLALVLEFYIITW